MSQESNNNEFKGILISLLIHTVVVAAVVNKSNEPMKLIEQPQSAVSIDLIRCPKPEPIPEPKIEPKPKVEPKPKPIKKHKPIVHKKPEPKPEPIEETIVEEKKLEPVVEPIQESIEPKVIKPIQDVKQLQKEFVKTNFSIIRDMVLSNLKYPMIAKRMGWSGVSEVELVVDTTGKLIEFTLVNSSGKKQLDEAALNAVKSIFNQILPKPKHTTRIILPISFKIR